MLLIIIIGTAICIGTILFFDSVSKKLEDEEIRDDNKKFREEEKKAKVEIEKYCKNLDKESYYWDNLKYAYKGWTHNDLKRIDYLFKERDRLNAIPDPVYSSRIHQYLLREVKSETEELFKKYNFKCQYSDFDGKYNARNINLKYIRKLLSKKVV